MPNNESLSALWFHGANGARRPRMTRAVRISK
jgi:hypothetical protein